MGVVCWEELPSVSAGLFAEQEEKLPELVDAHVAYVGWFELDLFPVPSYLEPVRDGHGRPGFCSVAVEGIRCCVVQPPVFL